MIKANQLTLFGCVRCNGDDFLQVSRGLGTVMSCEFWALDFIWGGGVLIWIGRQ